MFRRVMGWVLVVIGIICVGGQIDDLRKGKTDDAGIGFVMITVILGGGILLLRSAANRPVTVLMATAGKGTQDVPLETTVLRLARSHKGRVTPVEIATDAGISLEMAKEELERLMKAGACSLDVSEAGILVFRFAEFEDATAKDQRI
jgi:hypothetical protein